MWREEEDEFSMEISILPSDKRAFIPRSDTS